MCYTGLCEWEYSSGPDTGDCSWPGWGSGEKPPCPEPEVEAKERDVREEGERWHKKQSDG